MRNICRLSFISLLLFFSHMQASDGFYTYQTRERNFSDGSTFRICVTCQEDPVVNPELKNFILKVGAVSCYMYLIRSMLRGDFREVQSLQSIVDARQSLLILKTGPGHHVIIDGMHLQIIDEIRYSRFWPTDLSDNSEQSRFLFENSSILNGETMEYESIEQIFEPLRAMPMVFHEDDKNRVFDTLLAKRTGRIFYDDHRQRWKVE